MCSCREDADFARKVKMRLVAETDAPKGVAFVVARMEKASRVARIIKLGVKYRKKLFRNNITLCCFILLL